MGKGRKVREWRKGERWGSGKRKKGGGVGKGRKVVEWEKGERWWSGKRENGVGSRESAWGVGSRRVGKALWSRKCV